MDNIEGYYEKHQDLVFFLIGCSFSFEKALIDSGIPLRHITDGNNVAMYNTDIPLNSVDEWRGNMVVSMRPIHRTRVADACVITHQYAKTHGSPIHIGYP